MECPRRAEGSFGDPTGDEWTETKRCTYCGSMAPYDLFKAIEDGAEITPTDKNYKIYVNETDKFYFQHLNDKPLQEKFFNLYKEKKINFSYPGDFYVLPFFIKRGK